MYESLAAFKRGWRMKLNSGRIVNRPQGAEDCPEGAASLHEHDLISDVKTSATAAVSVVSVRGISPTASANLPTFEPSLSATAWPDALFQIVTPLKGRNSNDVCSAIGNVFCRDADRRSR